MEIKQTKYGMLGRGDFAPSKYPLFVKEFIRFGIEMLEFKILACGTGMNKH